MGFVFLKIVFSLSDFSEGYQINSVIFSPQRDSHILVWECAFNKICPQSGWDIADHSTDVWLLSPCASYGCAQCESMVSISAVLTGLTTTAI